MGYRYSSIERERLERAVAYFTKHPDEKITIAILKKYCLMNRNKIEHWFRRQFGETAIRYFHRQRMEKAMALVLETDLRMPEISVQVGYRDATNFQRAFKEYWGETPGALRMRHLHL